MGVAQQLRMFGQNGRATGSGRVVGKHVQLDGLLQYKNSIFGVIVAPDRFAAGSRQRKSQWTVCLCFAACLVKSQPYGIDVDPVRGGTAGSCRGRSHIDGNGAGSHDHACLFIVGEIAACNPVLAVRALGTVQSNGHIVQLRLVTLELHDF